jgi:ribosomal protein S21
MLIIPIKDGENIDRALKRYKESLIKQELFVNLEHVQLLLSLL